MTLSYQTTEQVGKSGAAGPVRSEAPKPLLKRELVDVAPGLLCW